MSQFVNLEFPDRNMVSIYNSLQDLSSIESIMRDREELLSNKDNLNDLCFKKSSSKDDLRLHGFEVEEIENLEKINKTIKEGKEKLMQSLRDYNICVEEILKLEETIKVLNIKIQTIKDNLLSLSQSHTELYEIAESISTSLVQKQEEIKENLESELGIQYIKRDKLESILKFLSASYGIIKNTPLTHTCPICITNEVDTYLNCGHTCCKECNVSKFCHMCRTKINSSNSIYYS